MSEFEVLKASHRFLRDDGQTPAHVGWDEEVARKFEASLFREFAVCDLKHYKSGQFALRWRTEDEVVSGAGQTTCGNTRCDHHAPRTRSGTSTVRKPPTLKTLELPFSYLEHGQQHSALVKVVLCERCTHKIMWKRSRDKEERQRHERDTQDDKLALQLAATDPAARGERWNRRPRESVGVKHGRSASPHRRNERDDRPKSRGHSRFRSPTRDKGRLRRDPGSQHVEDARMRVKIESSPS